MENFIEPNRPQMAIRRLRIARWIPKFTNTYSEYVIRIAFPPQQRLQDAPQCYPMRNLPVLSIVKLSYIYSPLGCKGLLKPRGVPHIFAASVSPHVCNNTFVGC